MDWDDVRYFLALSRCGSVRAAGDHLGVSHSTVARRMEAFEAGIGVRLFDRTPRGYLMTVAGEDMMETALRIEEDMNGLARRLVGQDARLAGRICVTFADNLTSNFLMPFIVEFSDAYPDIDLEMILSYRALDLSKREADVAIRYYRPGSQPPDHLIGRKLASVHYAHYASPAFLRNNDLDLLPSRTHWTAWQDEGRYPDWVRKSPYPHIPTRHILENGLLQMQAASHGLGIGMLPCMAADRDPGLVRLPGSEPRPYFDLWILSHPDLRETARLRLFRQMLTKSVVSHLDVIEGRSV
ncbi:MAG: LysR family transcriptional regulator [Rhodospirillales bacterium]|nr:LysR family transcriptional regulator [Rhodospirillales bacterium]